MGTLIKRPRATARSGVNERFDELMTELRAYRKRYGRVRWTRANLEKRPKLRRILREIFKLLVEREAPTAPSGYRWVRCVRRWHPKAMRYLDARDYGRSCWTFLVPVTE